MNKRLRRLWALFCIELIVLLPVLTVYALNINQPQISIEPNSVTMVWSTSVDTNTTISYVSVNGTYEDTQYIYDSTYKLNHTQTIDSLTPGEKYGYIIVAYSRGNGSTAQKDEYVGNFIIPDSDPPPAPVNLTLAEMDEEKIKIQWNDIDTSIVGDVSKYIVYKNGINIANTTFAKYTDSANITGNTNYVYQVAAYDNTGNIGQLSDSLIVTTPPPDVTPPDLYNIKVITLSNTSAMVYWQTNELSNSIVFYGKGRINQTQSVNGLYINHTVNLNSLQYNQQYSYIASSCDKKKNCRNGSMMSFVAGGDTTPPTLRVNSIPTTFNMNSMPINGTTDPLIRVLIYLNNVTVPQRAAVSNIDGEFYTNVNLDTARTTNTIIVKAVDNFGNEASQQFTVNVDTSKPILNISAFPALSTSSSITVNGSISEDVTLNIYVVSEQDASIGTPGEVQGLDNDSVTSSSVRLTWTALNSSEKIKLYRIYRNGGLRGTASSASFTDCTMPNTSYSYQVSAVNENCVEGPMSYSLSVRTTSGSNCSSTNNLTSLQCDGSKPDRTVQINQGTFRQSVSLKPGNNQITLEFVDDAGNKAVVSGNTIYDVKAPTITWNNLNDLTPTYDSEITVRGRVDENATVTITVNNDSTYVGRTDSLGNFSIEIELDKIDYDDTTSTTSSGNQITGRVITGMASDDSLGGIDANNYYSYRYGNSTLQTTSVTARADDGSWKNRVTIVAVDGVGRNSSAVSKEIEYKMCSQGSWWGITLSDPQPSMLLPRHLLNGIAQINFNYALEWLGGTGSFDTEKTPSVSAQVSFRTISKADKSKWDVDWFSVRSIPKPNSNNTEGYVVLQSKVLNSTYGNSNRYRRSLTTAVRTNTTANFTTSLEMEQNISDHRKGECLVSTFGCVKLPLQIELRFTDPAYQSGSNNIIGDTSSSQGYSITQRQCWDIEMAIDRRIDTDVIPESFLRKAVNFLNKTIELIDKVLVPLNKIKEYTLYACLGSWVILYTKALSRRWNCEFSGALKSLTGSGFKPAVAEQGLCKYFYEDKSQNSGMSNEKLENCQKCTESYKAYVDFEEKMHYICDRIACPSAPSFMKYVRTMQNKRGTDVTVNYKKEKDSTQTQPVILTKKSDCAGMTLDFTTIEQQYLAWKSYTQNGLQSGSLNIMNPQTSSAQYLTPDGKSAYTPGSEPSQNEIARVSVPTNCYEPHSPNNLCCVVEYMRTYDSVCGLWDGMLFDEMKESYCVAGTFSQGSIDSKSTYNTECGGFGRKAWNALAGICEKNPQQQNAIIDSHVPYETSANDYLASQQASSVPANDKTKIDPTSSIKVMTPQPSATYDEGKISKTDKAYVNGQCPQTLRPGDEVNIFYRVTPNSDQGEGHYTIHRGVVYKNIDIQTSVVGLTSQTLDFEGDTPVGSSLVFHPLQELSEDIFKTNPNENLNNKNAVKDKNSYSQGYYMFKQDMESCASKGSTSKEDTLADEAIMVVYGCEPLTSCNSADGVAAYYLNTDKKAELKKYDTEISAAIKSTPSAYLSTDRNTNAIFFDKTLLQDRTGTGYYMLKEKIKASISSKVSSSKDENYLSDKYVQKAYSDIQSAMGIADKDEIVDPSSSLLRSVQCLCLPGVTGFLKLWRAIMVAVKACLQTILITGDGNPGICQAVLTQYVCDLIYDLIKCFVNKYSSGRERSYGVENFPGNILGTLTSAGRDVERSVSSRYGNSQFFKAMFGERQLVHAVCLWFFTGTFDFDFNSLTEGEFGDIPVDSQGLLSPCQRRFISYNNANQGKTTWNYYFGVGFVAGASLTYRLYLQCSQDYSCDYGYGNEQCDCADMNSPKKRTVSLRNAQTTLARYDVLEETYDNSFEDTVRYDKVVLEYYYTDKDNQRVSKNVTCDLRTVGGQAPGFCQFDAGQGMYRCSVDIGEEDYAILVSAEGKDIDFDEAVTVNTMVKQSIPDTMECTSASTCAATKYLCVSLRYGNLELLSANNECRPILIDGTMSYSMPYSNSLKITKQLLQGSGTTAGLACSFTATGSFVKSCSGSFTASSQSLTLKYDSSKKITATASGFTGYFSDSSGNKIGTGNECTASLCYYRMDGTSNILTIVIDTNVATPPTGTPELKLQPTTSSQSSSSGSSDVCAGKQYIILDGRATIYDSQETGGIYSKGSTVYSYNGEAQQKDFTVKVDCRNSQSSSSTPGGTTWTFSNVVNEGQSKLFTTANPAGTTLSQLSGSTSIAKNTPYNIYVKGSYDLNSVIFGIKKTDGTTVYADTSLTTVNNDLTQYQYSSTFSLAPGTYILKVIVRAQQTTQAMEKEYSFTVSN